MVQECPAIKFYINHKHLILLIFTQSYNASRYYATICITISYSDTTRHHMTSSDTKTRVPGRYHPTGFRRRHVRQIRRLTVSKKKRRIAPERVLLFGGYSDSPFLLDNVALVDTNRIDGFS